MTATRTRRPQCEAAGRFFPSHTPGRRPAPRLRQHRLSPSDREWKSVRVPATVTPALRLDAPSPWRRGAPDHRVGSGR
jgi:hypothetical protein